MNNYKKLLKVDFTTLVGKSLERAKKLQENKVLYLE